MICTHTCNMYGQAQKGSRSRTRTCMFNGATCPTGISNEPLIETKACTPANRVWHGESNLATYSTNAGIWNNEYPRFALKNIFDNDASTVWHSKEGYKNYYKIITINFKVSFRAPIFT